MLGAEMVKEALRICTQSGTITCVDCPYFNDMTCVNSLASDAAEYIASLEERISIMQESMEALEKRCNAIDALEQRCKALEALEKQQAGITWHNFQEKLRPIVINCSTCGKTLYAPSPFCPHCGARMCEVSK